MILPGFVERRLRTIETPEIAGQAASAAGMDADVMIEVDH
jgi:hypothetical protein